MRYPLAVVIGLAAVTLGASRCASGVKPDEAMAAIVAGDRTALIRMDGCGFQPITVAGYFYCRVAMGPVGQQAVTFIVPPEANDCESETCADIKFFYPDGAPAYSAAFPKGQTTLTVPWRTLTGKDTFTREDRGFWPFVYEIRWKDETGRVRRTITEGELRLRVYQPEVCDETNTCKSYLPLDNQASDKNFVWTWIIDGQTIRMTTGGRTYVGPRTP